MNDPHVVALFYRIGHGDSVDYSKTPPLFCEERAFRLEVKDKRVRFEFKEHYATEDEARNAVEDYIGVWEFSACLENGLDSFRLNFERVQIEDRNPPLPVPGVKNIAVRFQGAPAIVTVKLSVVKNHYPPLPSGLRLCPDVQTMYDRYMGYRRGKEPLASMAYFCLTMFEKRPLSNRGYSNRARKSAANEYWIDLDVLSQIGELSSEKGGQGARKARGINNDLTNQESRFLNVAVRAIIRRVAEKAYCLANGDDLPQISLADLPPI